MTPQLYSSFSEIMPLFGYIVGEQWYCQAIRRHAVGELLRSDSGGLFVRARGPSRYWSRMERLGRAEPRDDNIGEDWEAARLACRAIEKFDRVARSPVRLTRPRMCSMDVEPIKWKAKPQPSLLFFSLS